MAKAVTNGCVGLCCAAFYLPFTLSELRKRKDRLTDGEQIADMVIPLTPQQARERNRQFGGTTEYLWSNRGHHFTCKHWDEETRLCGIYETRPLMCRGYPYGREGGCNHGCPCKGKAIREAPADG